MQILGVGCDSRIWLIRIDSAADGVRDGVAPVRAHRQPLLPRRLERFPLVVSTAVVVLSLREVTMAPYSMDLRKRVIKAFDTCGDAEEVATTFGVSRAWVHRLAQRRRDTGSIAPRPQTKFRSRVLAGQEQRLATLIAARPDATLAELQDELPVRAALTTIWREIDRLNLTVKKNRPRR